jgi:hypothetical protein
LPRRVLFTNLNSTVFRSDKRNENFMPLCSTLLVAFLMSAFSPAFSLADTPVKLLTSTPLLTTNPIEICPSCTEVRVLLVPDTTSTIKLNEGPKVEAVFFNGLAPRDDSKFMAQWLGKNFPEEIKVTLDPDETKQVGRYDLYLNLQPLSDPGAGRLKIQFTRLSAAISSAGTLVKLETTTPIEICPSCDEVRVRLAPDPDSKIKVVENPKVEAAYFNGTAPRDDTKYTAQWIGGHFPREIKIIWDPDETKNTGVYDLYLNLQPNSNPGADRLKIQLMRPAASLEAIPKLIIDRTCWIITGEKSHSALRVTETSKKSRITISGVRPVSNTVNAARPMGGTLVFPQKQPEIWPGDQVTLDYTLEGSFGLGTASGTMKIDAPQLTSPVTFDFEVRSRVHWIWIGITIVVALCVSWLVKVLLQQKIELDQAILDAQKLVERIEREAEKHPDPDFSTAYKDELANLKAALGGRSAVDINATKLALDTKWQTALKEHEKKHQDERDALEKLRDQITNPNWVVPTDIIKAIEEARTGVNAVEQLLSPCNLKNAGKKRINIITDLGNEIRNRAVHWQNSMQTYITTIQAAKQGIPSAISAWQAQSTANLLPSLHKVDENADLDTIEKIHQTLDALKFERTAVKEFFDRLSYYVQSNYETAAGEIPESPPTSWSKEIFSKAKSGVDAFAKFLKSLVDNPNATTLGAELKNVHEAWTDALQGQFNPPNTSVKPLLDACDYIQATVVAFHEWKRTKGMLIAGAGPPQPSGSIFLLPPFYPDMTGAGPSYANYTRYQTVTMPSPAIPTSVTAASKLWLDKLIQSAIIGLLVILAGYGLQLNTFVGTFTDFSTLFFWAFALDLTVEQVGRITKKI